MSIAKQVGVEVATRAIVWVGGAALLIFVAPKVLPWLTRQVAGQAGNIGNAAGQVVGTVGRQFAPMNPENIFYQIVNGAGTGLTGDKNFTLGGWLYDMTHPEAGGK